MIRIYCRLLISRRILALTIRGKRLSLGLPSDQGKHLNLDIASGRAQPKLRSVPVRCCCPGLCH